MYIVATKTDDRLNLISSSLIIPKRCSIVSFFVFYPGFNSRLRPSMSGYGKRNFDEIDRYGKFNKRLFREVEDLGAISPNSLKQHGSNLADEMAVINEYAQWTGGTELHWHSSTRNKERKKDDGGANTLILLSLSTFSQIASIRITINYLDEFGDWWLNSCTVGKAKVRSMQLA